MLINFMERSYKQGDKLKVVFFNIFTEYKRREFRLEVSRSGPGRGKCERGETQHVDRTFA